MRFLERAWCYFLVIGSLLTVTNCCRVLELTQLSIYGRFLQAVMILLRTGPYYLYKSNFNSIIWLFYIIILISCFGSLVESPTRRVDPLLHSYTDYEDSVYGNFCKSETPFKFSTQLNLTIFTWLQTLLGVFENPGYLHHCLMMGG